MICLRCPGRSHRAWHPAGNTFSLCPRAPCESLPGSILLVPEARSAPLGSGAQGHSQGAAVAMAQSYPVQDPMERALSEDVTSFGHLYTLRVSDKYLSAVGGRVTCM